MLFCLLQLCAVYVYSWAVVMVDLGHVYVYAYVLMRWRH